jgi:hypothetical protein
VAEQTAAAVEHEHDHGRDGFVWQLVDTLVLVALVVIASLAAEWLYTELRARRTVAHADLIAAQASVAHATAANAPVPNPDAEE